MIAFTEAIIEELLRLAEERLGEGFCDPEPDWRSDIAENDKFPLQIGWKYCFGHNSSDNEFYSVTLRPRRNSEDPRSYQAKMVQKIIETIGRLNQDIESWVDPESGYEEEGEVE
jgi:hypothetical protein